MDVTRRHRLSIRHFWSGLCLIALLAGACSSAEDAGDSALESAADEVELVDGEASESREGSAEPAGSAAAAETSEDFTGPGADLEDAEVYEGPGGVLVWALDQEPPDLHLHAEANGLPVTAWIRQPLVEGLYGIDSETSFFPELLVSEGVVEVNDDGTVTTSFVLRDELAWSNGDSLTSSDVVYTWNMFSQGCELEPDGTIGDGSGCVYLMSDRSGYDEIIEVVASSGTEFAITTVKFFPGWQALFDEIYHPSFGATASELNLNMRTWTNSEGPLPSSGPLNLVRWVPAKSIDLARNDEYHGSRSPDVSNGGAALVNGVEVRFVSGTEEGLNALRLGQAQVLWAPFERQVFTQLETDPATAAELVPGTLFEHWGFNLLNRHLNNPRVREAIVYAIDKAQFADDLYGASAALAAGSGELSLGNSFWMPNQQAYEDHQIVYEGPQAEIAAQLLEAEGYVLGADGVFAHPSLGPLVLRVGTTGGDGFREEEQRLLATQLEVAGIATVVTNSEGLQYFDDQPFAPEALVAAHSGGASGDTQIWDVAQFSWLGGAWPGGQAAAYLAGSNSNPYGFGSEEFDSRQEECAVAIDPVARAQCYNDLDRFVTTLELDNDGLFVVPLVRRAKMFAYLPDVLSAVGVVPGSEWAGPLSNIVDFEFAEVAG